MSLLIFGIYMKFFLWTNRFSETRHTNWLWNESQFESAQNPLFLSKNPKLGPKLWIGQKTLDRSRKTLIRAKNHDSGQKNPESGRKSWIGLKKPWIGLYDLELGFNNLKSGVRQSESAQKPLFDLKNPNLGLKLRKNYGIWIGPKT